ncbi:hypothetical protein L21SP5_00788 [Salinivirga cyanobacteriivorans]|uniref:Uncharacterized protein n=1 Tax=Salinivirga cyanobacteriivorans TaxID=1307839 RepID=A0A0S2HWP8_9BACT|nr:hypothetical protein [Salinivirga cyanobacteriivorans]ALO14459.1 hypothetical protein L21SP5_00788 [Salinivirga cyanobacteriivorans]
MPTQEKQSNYPDKQELIMTKKKTNKQKTTQICVMQKTPPNRKRKKAKH